eukprot:m.12751 g.12751  ORF g.12751 m.12751 type:complete len:169 (+) comp7318_c0_seq2:182-688(+)
MMQNSSSYQDHELSSSSNSATNDGRSSAYNFAVLLTRPGFQFQSEQMELMKNSERQRSQSERLREYHNKTQRAFGVNEDGEGRQRSASLSAKVELEQSQQHTQSVLNTLYLTRGLQFKRNCDFELDMMRDFEKSHKTDSFLSKNSWLDQYYEKTLAPFEEMGEEVESK